MAIPTQLTLLAGEPELPPEGPFPRKPVSLGIKRVLMPNWNQLELRAIDLESLLPEGHRARLVWAYVMHTRTSTRSIISIH